MLYLKSELERELWRNAALAAIGNVDGAKPSDDSKVLKFAAAVADGLIRDYRIRCEKKE